MKIIAVSGGSGAGKSTVSRLLAEQLPNALHVNGDFFMHQESNRLENDIIKKIGVEKDKDIFSYNYYLESFDNVKIWVDTIKDNVINRAKRMIETEGADKDYIILDWVFLPMCDYFKECDYEICVKADFEIREDRLIKRLQDKTLYNEGDRSFWSYKPGIIQKRLEYTELDKFGYSSEYEIINNGNIEDLKQNINELVKCIINDSNVSNNVYKFFSEK